MVPTFHGAEGEGGGGHHVAAGLHLVKLGHEGGQLVGGQVLLPLQVHADFLPDMSAKLEIGRVETRTTIHYTEIFSRSV